MGNCKSSDAGYTTTAVKTTNSQSESYRALPQEDDNIENAGSSRADATTPGGKTQTSKKSTDKGRDVADKPIEPFVPSDPGATVESVVCQFGDLKDGEMREVSLGKGKALLVREHGEYSAVGSKCTHYGAPLVKGALYNGRVRCPWHGACFNTKTGDIEENPGLDSLPKFEVEVRGGQVVVKTTQKVLESNKRVKQMACWSPDTEKTCLIIGGGGASISCAETLRQEGFTGKLIVATKEAHLPYDRPRLSKALTSSASDLALRKTEFFSIYDIEVETGKQAVSVDTMLKSVTFSDDSSIKYDTLVIATGGRPRGLDCPGSDLEGVMLLRSPEDGNAIAARSKGKNAVIIGNSFIGMEVAAYLSDKAKTVTVVGRSDVPFKASLGKEIGAALKKLAVGKGVKFVDGASVTECVGDDGQLKEVVLSNGDKLPADACVLGIGVLPATDFLLGSGIEMNSRGHVLVNKYMRTNKDDVYAAGDIVDFPLYMTGDQRVSIGHWQMAHAHGRIAALNIMDQEAEIQSVPYFWTQQYGKSVRYCGYNAGYDDLIVHGNPDELTFMVFYLKEDHVIAAASMGRDPLVSQVAELMTAGKAIHRDDIRDDPEGFLYHLSA